MTLKPDLRYLQLLSQKFPNIASASTEIINLQAILNLPKGTEHFVADLHGEDEAFLHILKNASGNIKRKVNELYGSQMTLAEKRAFCALIYYPEEKLRLIKQSVSDINSWYRVTIPRMVAVCREISVKYTRSKVHKALPADFRYIIEELLHETGDHKSKATYIQSIVDSIISTGRADDFIIAIAMVIQRLTIDQLHILGDIFDRGSGAHIILDTIRHYHHWDIQWGNHDILWMGARASNLACICNVIRLSLRYANLVTLEEGYGISMMPLATFAIETYKDDPCTEFIPKVMGKQQLDERMMRITAQMHKAISVMQFKAEAQLIHRHPEWQMDNRCMLERIDYERGVVDIDGVEYSLTSCSFPTVNPADPSAFSPEEAELLDKIARMFAVGYKFGKHIRAILSHGSMYKVCNGNLLYHAAIPLNDDGSMRSVEVRDGKCYAGRELLDVIDHIVHRAFHPDAADADRQFSADYFLYLWCGPQSPLFCKSKMATFERYFIADKQTHVEQKGNYFRLRDTRSVIEGILDAFQVHGKHRHVINGHVPVHVANGENPIKADGLLMVIDGGFSLAYHKETGIAGYTLVYHSRGFELVQHEAFSSTEEAIINGTDIKSSHQIVEMAGHRILVEDTDIGHELKRQIADLKQLLYAYRHDWIKEK